MGVGGGGGVRGRGLGGAQIAGVAVRLVAIADIIAAGIIVKVAGWLTGGMGVDFGKGEGVGLGLATCDEGGYDWQPRPGAGAERR